jgi:hypothetical protein
MTYPQLMHYPVVKRHTLRSVVNRAPDGSAVRLADPAGASIAWQLRYTGLNDAELATLEQFFATAEGTLNGFTFLDPAANLLASSGSLDQTVWVKGPGLTLTAATPGWHIGNPSGADQSIEQTLAAAPAGYLYCLSAQVRGTAGATVTMLAGSASADRVLTGAWQQIVFAANADAPIFGLAIPAGGAVDLLGMQVEAQAAASVYRDSTGAGVYEGARFADDALEIVTTDVNRHSCTVNIIYVNHL